MKLIRFRITIARAMVVIVIAGFSMFAIRHMLFANTVYSTGFDEIRFQQVRDGMTSAEVEALVGPPLEKVPWPEEGVVIWLYTDKRYNRGNYWKRDVFMNNGKVDRIISMYWID